jgi:hypothetical protein
VAALLKLAEWYQDHSITYEGGERCTEQQEERYPPAINQTAELVNPSATLGGVTGRDSSTDIATVESDGAAAASATYEQGGGQ